MVHVKESGVAFLCFLPNDSAFQGVLTGESGVVYSLAGSTSSLPKQHFHECCFDGVPQFYSIEMALTENGELVSEYIYIDDVMRIGGDNCRLHLQDILEFNTDELLVGKQAEEYIAKYFPNRFANKDCYICVGEMSLDYVTKDSECS